MTRRALQSIHIPPLTSAPAAKHCPACKQPWRRQLSSTPQNMTRLRAAMFYWINSRGKAFEDPVQHDTNYLTDYNAMGLRREDESQGDARESGRKSRQRPKQPFPLNDQFISQPILSEELRKEIWRRVTVDKKSLRIVSVELGVELRRVGAVVRLMEVEKQWRAEVSNCKSSFPCPIFL